MRRKFLLLVLLVVAAGSLSGCDIEPNKINAVCVKDHVESGVRFVPTAGVSMGGIPMGSNMEMIPYTETVCDDYQYFPNPAWEEWHKRHPER